MDKKKILVFLVESNEDLLELTYKILRKNYSVVFTNCEETAIKIFKNNYQEFDLVVVDFYMEHGMTLMKEMAEIDPIKPTLTIGGTPICSAEEGCEFCQCTYYRKRLMMPFTVEKLYHVIENFEIYQCELLNMCDKVNKEAYRFLF